MSEWSDHWLSHSKRTNSDVLYIILSMTHKIEKFVCPEVGLPSDFRRRAQKSQSSRANGSNNQTRDSGLKSSSNNTQASNFSKDSRKRKVADLYDDMDLTNKDEVRSFMRTVKEFNANSELGSSRRNFQADLLTQLGAPPPKQQKMPFKLRLKLDDARKKREDHKLEELRQSDEVTAVHKKLLQKASLRKEKRKARK